MKLAKKLSVIFMAAALAAAPVAGTFVEPTAIVEAKEATISDETLTLDVGDTYQLKATGMKKAKWTSSDKSVAKVNKKNGTVTAVGEGTATITAKKGKKKVSCTVTVYKYAVTLDKTTAEVYEGSDITLTATVNPETATPVWSSSDEAVATVADGKVEALKPGKATITVEIKEGVSASCELTVLEAQEFDIDPELFTNNGVGIWYFGVLDNEATYIVDDVECEMEVEEETCVIWFPDVLPDGDHTLVISKEGYKDFVYNFSWEAPKSDGIFMQEERWQPWVSEGILYAFLNPELENAEIAFTVDGKAATVTNSFVSGDGVMVVWIDVTGISAGEHTLAASVEGFDSESVTFTVGEN